MFRLPRNAVVMAALLACAGRSQQLLDEVSALGGPGSGLRLEGVSIFSGYSSSAYPLSSQQVAQPGASALGPDVSYGGMATASWQRHRERTHFSTVYTGIYTGSGRFSNLNAYGQSLNLTFSRTLGRKWEFTATAAGQDTTMAQFLFVPTQIAVISQLPASFDDLAAQAAIGQYSNAQTAAMLTGAPILESPARGLLLGNRILSYAVNTSISYAASSRLSIHFSSFGAAGQSRGGNSGAQNYLMPRTLGATVGAGFSYSLSPRTTVGLDADELHQTNRYQSAYVSTARASLGRKMTEHLFIRGTAGAAFTTIIQQLSGTPSSRQVVAGASLGYKTYSHTLLGSYDRTSSDSFGFAVGTVTAVSGAWNWHRRGSKWNFVANVSQDQIRNTGFTSLNGWQASTAVTENLTNRAQVTLQYTYLKSNGSYAGTLTQMNVQSVRLSLGWSPERALR